jgi:myo-inositol-1(or 4)-monophosphatase
LDEMLVATGFGYDRESRGLQGDVVASLLPRIRDIRRMGAAALDLCSVAAGRVDAYYETGLSIWDLAAGWLVAAEAGAAVESIEGGPPRPGSVLAAHPGRIGEMRSLLMECGVREILQNI